MKAPDWRPTSLAPGQAKPRVEVTYTDDAGRRWEIHDFALIMGHRYRRHPGEKSAHCRGFYCRETGEKRVYHFTDHSEDRTLLASLLAEQLEKGRLG